MNTYQECEFIKSKYIKYGIIDVLGNKLSEPYFDPYIYPWEYGYVPKCQVCGDMYTNFKVNNFIDNKLEAKHSCCGCLWFDWFKDKIIAENKYIIFIDRQDKQGKHDKKHKK